MSVSKKPNETREEKQKITDNRPNYLKKSTFQPNVNVLTKKCSFQIKRTLSTFHGKKGHCQVQKGFLHPKFSPEKGPFLYLKKALKLFLIKRLFFLEKPLSLRKWALHLTIEHTYLCCTPLKWYFQSKNNKGNVFTHRKGLL